MVMMGSDLYAGAEAPELDELAESVPTGWGVAAADLWIERADLGPGVSTFYAAGAAIPPGLSGLPRHAVAPSPPATARTGRAR